MGQSLNITLTGVSMLLRFYAHICNTPFIKWILVILRLYSRVVQCEIRKFEVFDIDFSRPSPERKSLGTGGVIDYEGRSGEACMHA